MHRFILILLGMGLAALFFTPSVAHDGVPPPPSPVTHRPEAVLVFGGDMMFDRTMRSVMRQRGDNYLFSCIDGVLLEADLVIANLEGPITPNPSVSEGTKPPDPNNYRFTFDPAVAPLLFAHNVRLVNVGNNHIMNYGLEGLRQTKEYLRRAGVGYFGDPESPEAERVARVDINSIPFSFVNWSDWNSDNTDHTATQVAIEHMAGRVVVVYAHWGEEYVPAPERVKTLAREFIAQGASIVVGSHPHVVHAGEVVPLPPSGGQATGGYIYTSLGNFIFDQYFSEAVRNGLLLKVTFGQSGITNIQEIPITLERDQRTCPK